MTEKKKRLDPYLISFSAEDLLKKAGGPPLDLYLLESIWMLKGGGLPKDFYPRGLRWKAEAVSTDIKAINRARTKIERKEGIAPILSGGS